MLVAFISLAWLMAVWKLWWLAAFAGMCGIMLALHLYWIFNRKDRRIYAELAAVMALTSSAAACRYAITGAFDGTALTLWALNALFFTSSVFYVKMRVSRIAKKTQSSRMTLINGLYHTSLLAALLFLFDAGRISLPIVIAFTPVIIRALAGVMARGKLSLSRVGIAEVVFTVVFVCFMMLSFR
jgi:hypothetical protein